MCGITGLGLSDVPQWSYSLHKIMQHVLLKGKKKTELLPVKNFTNKLKKLENWRSSAPLSDAAKDQ